MPIDLDKLERLEREATPGPWHWKHNDIVQRDEAGKFVADVAGMYYDDDGYPNWGADNAANTELIIALRNAAPALFAELRTLRARVAELERDMDACLVDHADEAYEQGRRDAPRGVQGACLFEMGKLELLPMEYGGPHWNWEGFQEEMRMHDAFDRVAEAAEEAARCAPGCIDAELEEERRQAIESGDYDRMEEE